MAVRVGTSQKTLSRIESADRLPERELLRAWLTDVDDDTRARVLVLNDAAHVEAQSWSSLRRAGHLQGAANDDEEIATRIRCFTLGFVPGLLQTDDYARHLVPLVDPSGDHAAAVAARMQRQRRLFEPHRRFEFLLAEAALEWSPAETVMRAQRERLLSAATNENVTLAVVPSHRVGAPAWHEFILWDAPDIPSWVTAELAHARARTADPDLVTGIYEPMWDRLWDAALHGDDALTLIRATAAGS